jgi:DNA-binding winged helix-turn-helix (wHTH) protein/tetratricopeptide (TPR) repeat protein
MRPVKQADGALQLDLGRYELRRHGRRVKLEKKPMELLIFLVGRRDQLVSRTDIVRQLWRSDLFIDPGPNINNIVRKIRAALGDNPLKPRFLETVVGKGYRFIGPMQVIDARFPRSDSAARTANDDVRGRAPARVEHPSLAVVPLLALGNIPDDQGICLGFADGLLSRLALVEGVDVLPTSVVLHLPPEMAAREVGARLGVRFVVHGAIRGSKGQWHLSLEMFDTHLQSVCFSQRSVLDLDHLGDLEDALARQIAKALQRPMAPQALERRPRYSKDPLAYAEFTRGYRISSSGDSAQWEDAANHLSTAVARDPGFSLAHAVLSYVCATRHFEFDPASRWLEKAEFHCRRALELDPDLPEGHVAQAFLLWGPSKNFQHVEAIDRLRRALSLQNNLPHAYNRLGTILAHIGLLDHSREMYARGRAFHPKKAISHSVVQVYLWSLEYDQAWEEIEAWRAESPGNKYPVYFAPQLAMLTGDWERAEELLDEALQILPEEPLTVSLQGLFCALTGKAGEAQQCLTRACAIPKSFGHAHHTYYQVACILAVLGRTTAGFAWLERSVSTGFACWPFFMKDPSLQNLRTLPEFEVLVSSLQAKYPDHLGLL